MSTNANVCAEEVHGHEYLRKSIYSNVARLKGNSRTGCQVYGLLYRALETFYGRQLLEEHAQFLPCGRYFATFNVVLRTDRFHTLVDSDWGFTIGTEIVYEIPKLSLESDLNKPLDPIKLEGVYSPMEYYRDQCIKDHPQCQTESRPLLSKRVLDVGSSQGERVRLHESNGPRAYYIALSHRWGKSQLLTTTTSTLNARKESIAWSSLSRTFQDSISLTRLVGVRYPWIDSLYIVQDDPLDWEIESAEMAEIYEKSYVTISTNTTSGALLGQTAIRTNRSLQVDVVDFEGKLCVTCYFSSLPSKIPNMPAGAAPCDSAWEGWTRIVHQYVRKDITYSTDVLPALAGIATRVKFEELGRYIAGLWETQLPQGLFWFARGVSSCKETSISTAPGFSWASLAGTSKVNEATWMLTSLPEDDNTRQLFQVPDVQCDASSHNPFGLVTKASILLRGYLLPVKLKGEKGPPPCNAIIRSGTLEQHVTAYMDRAVIAGMGVEMDFTCFFGFTTKEENHLTYDKARRGTENKTTICLLLLECVGQDVYQRVGCVPEIENEGLWLKHAKEKEFMLI